MPRPEVENVDLLFRDIWQALALSQQRLLSANRLTEVLIGVGVTVTVTTVALAQNIKPWTCSSLWLFSGLLFLLTASVLGFYSRTIQGFTMLDLAAFLNRPTLKIETTQFKFSILTRATERIRENEHALRKKYLLTQGMFVAYLLEATLVAIWLLVR